MTASVPTLGVHLMPTAPVGQLVELAVFAESCGVTRCWLNDEGLNTRDPYVTLSAIAGRTERMLLGPGIANPYSRHPGITSAAIATLDEWSGGRAFLGLGAGGGMALGPLAIDRIQPRQTLEEMIVTTRSLWAGASVDHDGPAFSYRNARLPYGRADIPMFVAGRGPGVIDVAGRLADGCNLGYVHKSLLGPQVAGLRAQAAGRPFLITYTTMLVTSDEDMKAARAALTFRLIDSPPEVRDLVGVTPDHVRAIRADLASGGPTAAARHIEPGWVPQFMVVGSEAECADELSALLIASGIDEFQLPLSDPATGPALIERTAGWLDTRGGHA